LGEEGALDLVCGRPYFNLSREPRLRNPDFPIEYPFAALKAAPHKATYPVPVLNPAKGGFGFFLRLPVIFYRAWRSARTIQQLSQSFDHRLREEIFPAFAKEVAEEMARDLAAVDTPALVERLDHWIRRTLFDFARDALKPAALASNAMASLEQAFTKGMGPDRAQAAVARLIMGVHPDPEADFPTAVRALADGKLERSDFLKRFGHRGNQEMELARPRWAEEPWTISSPAAAHASTPAVAPEQITDLPAAWEELAAEAKLGATMKKLLESEVRSARNYLALRETAKHYFMLGYNVIRRILVELDRRFKLEDGIFYLTPHELPRLIAGDDLTELISKRRRRRELTLSIEAPQVIFSDDLEALGRPDATSAADTFQGVPLSAGVAEGEAFVLSDPAGAVAPTEPYVLVCPRTDPAWVPLFVNARALVMETGGILSHGAIVAREFNLPAVAGLPNVHRRLHSGQRVRVDGSKGTVTVLA
jgi:pyruvate,water dikinase